MNPCPLSLTRSRQNTLSREKPLPLQDPPRRGIAGQLRNSKGLFIVIGQPKIFLLSELAFKRRQTTTPGATHAISAVEQDADQLNCRRARQVAPDAASYKTQATASLLSSLAPILPLFSLLVTVSAACTLSHHDECLVGFSLTSLDHCIAVGCASY